VREALHAEWTKLRTLAAPAWLLAGTVVLSVALGVAVAGAQTRSGSGPGLDTTKISLTGIDLGQAAVAVLGVLVMSGEYSQGMIRVTLAALPRRGRVLASKAALLTGLTLASGVLAVLGSLVGGRMVLAADGLTAAHGYTAVSLSHATVLRAAGGTVLYLALIALLSFGVATAVHESAVATGVVLGLLYLFPVVAGLVPDHSLSRHLQQIGPMTAGLAVEATTNLKTLPLSPWAGLGVLAAWAGIALLVGGMLFCLRDA
jgi:ABC-2 type transport system permease protein